MLIPFQGLELFTRTYYLRLAEFNPFFGNTIGSLQLPFMVDLGCWDEQIQESLRLRKHMFAQMFPNANIDAMLKKAEDKNDAYIYVSER